jgi:hypothetical protein
VRIVPLDRATPARTAACPPLGRSPRPGAEAGLHQRQQRIAQEADRQQPQGNPDLAIVAGILAACAHDAAYLHRAAAPTGLCWIRTLVEW